MRLSLIGAVAVVVATNAVSANAQQSAVDVAKRVDGHYNHLKSLRARFTETYTGMGQHREESGILLLAKPGRMRWTYADGKLFLFDGKYAVRYTPGEPQAERLPAKQLDDMRSPLRFLLGHTRLEKELDGLTALAVPDGSFILSGRPHGAGADERLRRVTVTASPTGAITGLRLEEFDGATTDFRFRDLEENVPVGDKDFTFQPPAGVVVVDSLPPA